MPDKIIKFIQSLDEKTRQRLKEKLSLVRKNPYKVPGAKKMKGWGENVYRIRMGDIRIIYHIVRNDVEIIDIDYRGNIY